jgi:hypothetical protein
VSLGAARTGQSVSQLDAAFQARKLAEKLTAIIPRPKCAVRMVDTVLSRMSVSLVVAAQKARNYVEKINAMILRQRCAVGMGIPVLFRTSVSVVVAAQRAKKPAEMNAMIPRRRCAALIRRPPARKGTFASAVVFVARRNSQRSAARIGAIIRRPVSAAQTRKRVVDGRARLATSAAICLEVAMMPTLRSAAREAPVW